MFHYDGGLVLTELGLSVDVRRRRPRGFISHAHTDHMGRHELAYCTPATARFYWHRLGRRPTREMPFHEPLCWNGWRLTTIPAGHIFGSAMLLADDGEQRLLYTGDFKLSPSMTAEPVELPCADILVMETTYGDPRYRLPPREEAIASLVDLCLEAIGDRRAPVIHAYALGKAQEVTKILTSHGIPVQQHPIPFAISRIYAEMGCDLGDVIEYDGTWREGSAIVTTPREQRGSWTPLPARRVKLAATGWGIDAGAKRSWGVDHVVPLSDHADFDELLGCVERVRPRVVYCTHGPESFVDLLRRRGVDARPLDGAIRGV